MHVIFISRESGDVHVLVLDRSVQNADCGLQTEYKKRFLLLLLLLLRRCKPVPLTLDIMSSHNLHLIHAF